MQVATLYLATLGRGGTAFSHRVGADVYYGGAPNSVGVGLSAGEELENVQPFGVLRTPVRSFSVAGRQWLARNWFVAYDLVVHEQGSFYRRRRLGVSLGHRL
jgi:YaiO family outer membrane protein